MDKVAFFTQSIISPSICLRKEMLIKHSGRGFVIETCVDNAYEEITNVSWLPLINSNFLTASVKIMSQDWNLAQEP